ncbi:MAG: tripartite tricarboxylate transporter substrate binding protein [Betaproteobacteria bacterium]|nr:MAG: tripartite tricarboxylate transporter substrate binding protein [Betaproteobacteria bacterium]
MKSVVLKAVAGAVLAAVAGIAVAQSFPNKPVRIVVPFPPGGGVDIVARLVGPKLAAQYGQQVIVENRAGAAGIIGTEYTARAAPDGYTWAICTLGNLAVNKHIYSKMTVDPLQDLAAVTQVVDVHFVMVAHPSLPAKTVPQLIALAKRLPPGDITYSSSGAGGAPHLGGELLQRLTGIRLTHVPYKGSGPSFADLLGGHVSLTFDSMLQALPYIRDRKLVPLGVLGPKRVAALPEVPTIAEQGVPGYALTNWFGLVVPAATPKDLIARVHGDFTKALLQKDIRDRIAAMGADAVGNSPEAFAQFWRAESDKWARIVKDANIRAN